jgi:hypothetical protein
VRSVCVDREALALRFERQVLHLVHNYIGLFVARPLNHARAFRARLPHPDPSVRSALKGAHARAGRAVDAERAAPAGATNSLI